MTVARNRSALIAIGTLLIVSLVVAGCGGSSSSTSSGGGEATTSGNTEPSTSGNTEATSSVAKEVEELEQRPTSVGVETPTKKTPPKGKSVVFLSCAFPSCVVLGGYLEEAAAVLGWKVKTIQYKETPEGVKAGWEQLVRLNPDAAIITGGYPISYYKDQLEEFHENGGVAISYADPQPANPNLGIISGIHDGEHFAYQGEAMAKYVGAKAESDNILFVTSSGFPVFQPELEGFESELPKACPECELEVYDAPISSVGKDLGGRIAQKVQANPSINGIVLAFGDMAIGLSPALKGAGIESMPVVSQAQDETVNEMLRNGEINSIYASDNPESMWRAADELSRHFNEESLEPDEKAELLPKWFLTPENIPSGNAFPLVTEYQKQYEELWGL